jgi:hypothetical protein
MILFALSAESFATGRGKPQANNGQLPEIAPDKFA